ncbi:MAG: S8 family peptidase [Phaeodactylibacter sp.]|uniref:S8 family peptidase n=1 Tax=Phaeodactylibacter sp. TaxID=1940289 RepID=UPI0032ED66F8
METLRFCIFLTCSSLLATFSFAQSPIIAFPFDNNDDFMEWDTPEGNWQWVEDGKAEVFNTTLWDGRDSILSRSQGGAAAIAGTPGVLVSPPIDLSGESQVFLRFNQYYRALEGSTVVRVRNLSGGGQEFFTINQNVLPQVETGPRAVEVIDITSIAADATVEVSFFFETSQYFWIIDDVELYNTFPYPETRPAQYRDTFPALGYAYTPDDAGWPYIPNEIVVQIVPGTDPDSVVALRDTLGAKLIDSCVCNSLQLWELGDSVITNQNGMLFPVGPTLDILERVKGASSSVIIQEADPNYYTVAQLQPEMITDNPSLTQNDLAGIPDAIDDAVRIAVLDTGVDYKHVGLSDYIYKKPDALNNATDDDNNCAEDDPIGWDFVSEVDISNNPMDDHSHGTHVAGIIAQTLDQACTEGCRFQIIPYKTHDAQGVSSLFQVACATYQAIEDSVAVINDSWGFYGSGEGSDGENDILKNAIDSAELNNILVVSAAGNDALMLDTLLQYPACFDDTPNEITVGAVFDSLNVNGVRVLGRADFSNFSDTWVDILAPGVNIDSYLPQDSSGLKSGTSMSAPAVSAAAAIVYCKLGRQTPYADVKSLLLNTADKIPSLDTVAVDGNLLNILALCATPTQAAPLSKTIHFYPNPVRDVVQIELPPVEEAALEVFHLSGQRMGQWQVSYSAYPQTMDIDVQYLPAGTYLLRLRYKGQLWVGRLIKL